MPRALLDGSLTRHAIYFFRSFLDLTHCVFNSSRVLALKSKTLTFLVSITLLPSTVGIRTGSATRTMLLTSTVIDGSEFGHSSLHIALSRAGKFLFSIGVMFWMADDHSFFIDKEELPFSKSRCIRTSTHTIVLRVCPITPLFMLSLTRNPRKSFTSVFFPLVINYPYIG